MSATLTTTVVNNDAVPLADLAAPPPAPVETDNKEKTTLEAASIIFILTGVTFISVSGTGILTTALPQIASDINLENDLLLWPASVYALAAGCTLLAFGAVADIVGSKPMWLLGSGASSFWILGCGLAQSGTQFIAFRAMLGIFVAMCLPTSMSLVTASFPQGPRRNMAFAITGMGQPLGYAAGLILGGVLTDTIGWRWAFYITTILNFFLFIASIFMLPDTRPTKFPLNRLLNEIDWLGVLILAVSLGLLSYVLAMITLSYSKIGDAQNIALLVVSVALLPTFTFWMRRQEKRGQPALIPNSLWQSVPFLSICISMFFTWAAFNAFQYQSTLYFQDVQDLSALQASIRFLPMAVVGVLTNSATAYLVTKVQVHVLLGVSALITSVSPILMALASPSWTYWTAAFIAMTLSPLNGDVLWTVSSLVISRSFPGKSQALAGGVFNTISQLGNSVGLAITAAIAASVTAHTDSSASEEVLLLQGYRAAYWTIFAAMVLVCFSSSIGLRQLGKVGIKQD
ncbi:hypothetical protein N7451_009609 [Penicillium sp. IBT 35674x]|nr:hypothetical protein N7451_009609 [Penicillium sp. IBT 35674x]